MHLRDNELARRDSGQLALREEPTRVRWSFEQFASADRHDLHCRVECSVRAIDESTERRMLEEVLLDGKLAVTTADVAQHFQSAFAAALARTCESNSIEELLSDQGRANLLAAVKKASQSIAFSSGLEFLPPYQIELESPSLQAQRLRDMQRSVSERHATERVEHFQRSAELLKQFQAIRQSAPELSAGQVLQQISPTDRGSVLQTLLLASAADKDAGLLWAVAGPYLVKLDAREGAPATELFPLPPTLGPLRSVQPATIDGRRVLLVGARNGFMLVRPGSVAEAELYLDPEIKSDLGFNGVVYNEAADRFVGCHGSAGVVTWSRQNSDVPAGRITLDELRAVLPTISASATPRHPSVAGDGRVVFSFGNLLGSVDVEGNLQALPSASRESIVAVLTDGPRILVTQEDGTVCALDATTLHILCTQHSGGRLLTAGALPWLGATRLLLSTADGAIQCVGVDDPLVTQYASPQRGARVVAGSTRLVAALSGDRQRVILWNTWDGKTPFAEVYLAGVTRHRVADITFA